MRAYKFLDAHYGLKSLRERRLKISTIEDLNDPFELIPFDLSNRKIRWAFYLTRNRLALTQGMVCFSANWRDPVIWAHYADKHRGLCLGFDVSDEKAQRVTYVRRRLPCPKSPTLADADAMHSTKFDSWAYEQEIRMWAALNEVVDGLYFADFDEQNLKLMEVIAGARCTLTKRDLEAALGPESGKRIKVTKARAGFKEFEIVSDKRGFK